MQCSLGPACAVVVAAVFAVLLTFAPGSALASHVKCGDVITRDTTLDSDVICQVEDKRQEVSGLVIGADDVTLDLGGHTLQVIPPQGLRDGIFGITDDGVQRDRLRIVNGTLTGFTQSLSLDTSNSVVRELVVQGPYAIRLRGDHNLVTRNATRAGYGAIGTTGDGNRIVRNVVGTVEGPGIVAHGRDVRIAHNTVFPARGALFYEGIALAQFTDAVVVRNEVESSITSSGIELADGTGALVAHNFAHESLYGMAIRADASNVNLRRNIASQNEESGILVSSASTIVARNTANDNGNLGIEAVEGVIDGGGNRASGNGNPAQCVGVTCK